MPPGGGPVLFAARRAAFLTEIRKFAHWSRPASRRRGGPASRHIKKQGEEKYGKQLQTDARHRRVALRQRRRPHRPPGRRVRAGRHLRALPPPARPRGALRVRIGRARRARHHPRPQGGLHAAGSGGPLPPRHPRLVRGLRHLVRRVRPHHLRHPPPARRRLLPHALRQGRVSREGERAILRRGGRHLPGRPLHHRRVSPLPRRRRLWRPVREVRHRPLAHRAHQPPQHRERQRPRAAPHQALVPAPRQAPAVARALDHPRPQGLAPQRDGAVQVVARHGPPAPRREPRPRLGHPRARGGRRGQGALRMV